MRNAGNRSTNISGVKGIHWDNRDNKWKVQMWINHKKRSLGYFTDLTEAVAHWLAAEQAEGWEGCDSNSPAFQYMRGYLSS